MAPEMSECRNLVANFVELQRQLSGRVEALTGDITSQQHHIEALKHELNAVCQRQYNGEVTNIHFHLAFFLYICIIISREGGLSP